MEVLMRIKFVTIAFFSLLSATQPTFAASRQTESPQCARLRHIAVAQAQLGWAKILWKLRRDNTDLRSRGMPGVSLPDINIFDYLQSAQREATAAGMSLEQIETIDSDVLIDA